MWLQKFNSVSLTRQNCFQREILPAEPCAGAAQPAKATAHPLLLEFLQDYRSQLHLHPGDCTHPSREKKKVYLEVAAPVTTARAWLQFICFNAKREKIIKRIFFNFSCSSEAWTRLWISQCQCPLHESPESWNEVGWRYKAKTFT